MERVIWWKRKRPADFTWSEQLSVGNAILDSEHRNLITKINNITRMIEAGNATELPGAFEMLETWLMVHFENEKMFAQSIDLDFEQHELAHQGLLDELRCWRDELAAKNWAVPNSRTKSYYQLLHDRFIKHLAEDDMQMKPAFWSCRYDYIPPGKNSMVIGTNRRSP